jgi:GNAT superfamily N-acetyltransferase
MKSFHALVFHDVTNREWMLSMISEITCPDEKSALCSEIMSGLPEWFEEPDGISACSELVADMPVLADVDQGNCTGFVALKYHPPATAEIFVIATRKECHGRGIGRSLLKAAEAHARQSGCSLLTIKTLAPRGKDEPHLDSTRAFYDRNGFLKAEVFPTLWAEGHPCLFLVKPLH